MNNNAIDPIDKAIGQFITDKKMFVLRSKATGQALNTSYSEEGLKFTTSPNGRLLYFKDAKLARDYKQLPDGQWVATKVGFVGDLSPNPDVYVEQFVPKNHNHQRTQVAEYITVSKAYRFLYHVES
jgi:hypothetical protein